jgi:hypothetical protein
MKTIFKGIRNLIYWFKVIWNDRDYDSHYIFEVLKHKLKSQSKYIAEKDYHERAQTDARNMRICVSLIEKIQDCFYEHEHFDYYKEKIWFEDIKDKPGYSTLKSEEIWENFDMYFAKYPLIYKRVLNGEGKFSLESKRYIAMNIAEINHTRALNLLFRIMEKECLKWWM